jgi:hypothetical protein
MCMRAGFEPRRADATSLGLDGPENRGALGVAARTHGSNPARRHRQEMARPRRAEIFALPTVGFAPPAARRPPNVERPAANAER